MEMRYATATDREEIRSLWQYSFPDTEKENEFYFSRVYNENNTVVAIQDNIVAAALQMNPYVLHVGPHTHNVHYIVGVSVRPEYRGKGLSNLLMHYCLAELEKKEENIVLLMPIDTAIYRRYGFINVFFQHWAYMDLKDLNSLPATKYQIREVQHTSENAEILAYLYQKAMVSKHSFIQRKTEKSMRKMGEVESSLGQTYMIFDENHRSVGSFFFYLSSDTDGESFVDELIFLEKEVLWEVLRFCKGHQTQTQRIKIQAVNNDLFMMIMGYDNKIKLMLKPFMMARSLSPMRILQNMFLGKDLPDFLFFLKGDSIQKEDRLFFVSPQKSMIECLKQPSVAKPDITSSQEGLIMWYLQSAPLKTLEDSKEIHISAAFRSYFTEEFYPLRNYANEYI